MTREKVGPTTGTFFGGPFWRITIPGAVVTGLLCGGLLYLHGGGILGLKVGFVAGFGGTVGSMCLVFGILQFLANLQRP
jgi:hypothetical protein